MSSVEEFLSAPDIKRANVETESGRVLVRGLTAKEIVEVSRDGDVEGAESLEFMLDVVLLGTLNEDGQTPYFQEEHRPALAAKSQKTVKAIFQAILDLSGFDEEGND